MAIIHMGELKDRNKPGFKGSIYSFEYRVWDAEKREYIEGFIGPVCHYTYLSHEGLCIRDYERNGYDDSDFHMIVWNEETQAPEDICFASTRGWSYPCYGSWVDATDEVKAKYAAYQKKQEAEIKKQVRARKARAICEMRAQVRAAATEFEFPAHKLQQLRKRYDADQFAALVKLMASKRVRSEFKLKLRNQVIAWCKDSSPKYPTPLSKKQMLYV